MNKALLAMVVLLGGGALLWAMYGGGSANASGRIWPGDASVVTAPLYSPPSDFGVRRIVLDAGHGAENNSGNVSSRCQDEQDFTLSLARHVAPILEQSGLFEVVLSRAPGETVDYHARVERAEQMGADAFVSLHSDVRGEDDGDGITVDGKRCPRSRIAPGFSVLWSDQGDAALNAKRLRLARAGADFMQQMGILPYHGAEYRGLYDADAESAGVFVDRHTPDERIFVLHKPTMPSIIIETHNAWDDREAARWDDPKLRDAFGTALVGALLSALY